MIGVAQVIGMNPTASLVFSSGPDWAKASVAVAIGKIARVRPRLSRRRPMNQGAPRSVRKRRAQYRFLDTAAQAGFACAFAKKLAS